MTRRGDENSFDPLFAPLISVLAPLWPLFVDRLATEIAAKLANGAADAEIDQNSRALDERRCSPRKYLEGARAKAAAPRARSGSTQKW
jgi:hypothetical protein